ncbi:Gfo/Idh/MocA family oxidoreductase [Candidatus Dependentiae bacterium]|nr:Gfo/Idh/MocA family oxidoreductase [Candidatus Dependentiae bacterium]
MKFLVIGLGSMGKRRIRCLKSLGYSNISGFDLRKDRVSESLEKYEINFLQSINDEQIKKFDALIISTPPDNHLDYLKLAVKNKIPVFVEASVILAGLNELKEAALKNNVFIAPSCTLKFHPVIKEIMKIVKSKRYGSITNFSYHSGQYLPDWHPWEKVTDYYVSKKETGGCREIVPFELTWLTEIIGFPEKIFSCYGKTMNVGADIDDTYAISMKCRDCFGVLIVDVTSRFGVRNLVINFELAQIQWRWDDGYFKLFESEENRWIIYNQPEYSAAQGYNKNIIEQMYIDEISSFINGIPNPENYPNSLSNDIKILELLDKIES